MLLTLCNLCLAIFKSLKVVKANMESQRLRNIYLISYLTLTTSVQTEREWIGRGDRVRFEIGPQCLGNPPPDLRSSGG